MSRQRTHGTKPERLIRSNLHARGLRFRVQVPLAFDRRRRADLLFPSEKVAVFVDGCFWHRCPLHATVPRTNANFWQTKLDRNVQRDLETDARLRSDGWTVVRIWEHEDVDEAADRVEAEVRQRRS